MVWSGGFTEPVAPDRLPALMDGREAPSLDALLETLAAAPTSRTRWLRCRMRIPAGADYFRLTVVNPNAGIWWNGACVRPVRLNAPGTWGQALPLALPVPAGGEADLVIVTQSDKGLLQPEGGRWFRRAARPAVGFATTAGGWEIRLDETRFRVRAGTTARAEGWKTDARWLITAADGSVIVLAATTVAGPGVPAVAWPEPVHAAWNKRSWETQTIAPTPKSTDWPAQPMPVGTLPPAKSRGQRAAAALMSGDVAELLKLSSDEDWRVQCAAVERLGELGDATAAEPLRKWLAAELAQPLYPEMTGLTPTGTLAEEYAAIGRDTGSKRFRLVQALIRALHRLRDREALPLVRQALENKNHFYPVFVAGVRFLSDLATVRVAPGSSSGRSTRKPTPSQPPGSPWQRVARSEPRASASFDRRAARRSAEWLDLTCYGHRFNAFGSLHNLNLEHLWAQTAPEAWRTTGADWSYEYQLRPMGLLNAPVVMNGVR